MRQRIVISIVVAVIFGALAWAMTLENETVFIYPEVKSEVVKIKKIELVKQLVPICACESTGNKNKTPTHFDSKGNVLLGKINPNDTGLCQINVKIHKKDIAKLGLDVFKESDNIIFANWLYARDGLKPWAWSKACWQ